MLVLTRQEGQRICIGSGVVVTVLMAGRGRVRLGVESPPDVWVDGEEVRHRQARGKNESTSWIKPGAVHAGPSGEGAHCHC